MRLSLPGNADDLSKDIIALMQRRRITPPEGMTALIEVLVVAITMAPLAARRELTERLIRALRDNIDLVAKAGM